MKVNITFEIPDNKYREARDYWNIIRGLNMNWKKWITKVLTDNIDIKHLKVEIKDK